jgi:hypothetical protein
MLSFDSFFSFLSQLIVDLNDLMSLPCDLLPSGFLFELQIDIKERISPPAKPDLLWFKHVWLLRVIPEHSQQILSKEILV